MQPSTSTVAEHPVASNAPADVPPVAQGAETPSIWDAESEGVDISVPNITHANDYPGIELGDAARALERQRDEARKARTTERDQKDVEIELKLQARAERDQLRRERDEAEGRRAALAGWIVEDHQTVCAERDSLRSQLAESERERDEANSKLAKITRLVDLADKLMETQSDEEVAASASFNEALAQTLLEATERERDSLRAANEKLVGELEDAQSLLGRVESKLVAATDENAKLKEELERWKAWGEYATQRFADETGKDLQTQAS